MSGQSKRDRARIEHPLFAPLIALALHGVALASVSWIPRQGAAGSTFESDADDAQARFSLDLRGTSMLVAAQADLPAAPLAESESAPAIDSDVVASERVLEPTPFPKIEPPIAEAEPTPATALAEDPLPTLEPLTESTSPVEPSSLVSAKPASKLASEAVPPTHFLETGAGAPVHAEPNMNPPAGPPPPSLAQSGGANEATPKEERTATPSSASSTSSGSSAAPRVASAGSPAVNSVADTRGLHARSTPRPEYPSSARKRGEQGAVVCRLTIDRSGHVTAVDVVTSSGFSGLDECAVRALKLWRFDALELEFGVDSIRALQRISFELARQR